MPGYTKTVSLRGSNRYFIALTFGVLIAKRQIYFPHSNLFFLCADVGCRVYHEVKFPFLLHVFSVGLSSNRRPHSPRHKTASEYWIDTLRKTGQGG